MCLRDTVCVLPGFFVQKKKSENRSVILLAERYYGGDSIGKKVLNFKFFPVNCIFPVPISRGKSNLEPWAPVQKKRVSPGLIVVPEFTKT